MNDNMVYKNVLRYEDIIRELPVNSININLIKIKLWIEHPFHL